MDLLLNLNGLTAGHRTSVVLSSAAPVQALMFGDSAPLGDVRQMYQFADAAVAPPDQMAPQFQLEKPVWLPWIYHASSHAVGGDVQLTDTPAELHFDRSVIQKFGSPKSALLLASFNRPNKLDPATFRTWVQAAYRGKMVFNQLVRPAQSATQLAHQALSCGCAVQHCFRAVAAVGSKEYAKRLARADLALDTAAWSGHSTTLDILWSGTPVLATIGGHLCNRFGLAAAISSGGIKLPLVRNLKAFEDMIVRLGNEHQ